MVIANIFCRAVERYIARHPSGMGIAGILKCGVFNSEFGAIIETTPPVRMLLPLRKDEFLIET